MNVDGKVQKILRLLLVKMLEECEKKKSSPVKLCLLAFALAELASAKAKYPLQF